MLILVSSLGKQPFYYSLNDYLNDRDMLTFNVIKPNCESFKRNVYYSGGVEWDSLDSEVRNLYKIHAFKRI